MPEHNLHTETDCWTAIKNDDPQGLGHLYDAYVDKLFISAMLITNDRELAKDAIQEVFIEIWNYRKSLGDIRNSQAYLTKVLRRILFKKQRFNQHIHFAIDTGAMIATEQNAEELIMSSDTEREKQGRLRVAIAELSKRQKEIIELRFYHGLSYDQIAIKMGMNYQSVNNLAFRTYRRLRVAMTPLILAVCFFF
jgi:RNA polymerase sigma factor (sigma-70 family)